MYFTRFGRTDYLVDHVQQWLDHVESVRASQSDSRNDDRPKHPPFMSVPYVDPAVKRKHESQLPATEVPKRQRRGAKDSETNFVTSASILPLRDDLTLSPPASATSQSQSRQRWPSPARHKRLLEYATPKIRYLSEWDNPDESAALELGDFLSAVTRDWEPDLNRIQEIVSSLYLLRGIMETRRLSDDVFCRC